MDPILMHRYELTTEDCDKTVTYDHLHSISGFNTQDLRSVLQYLDMKVEEDIDFTGKEKKIEFLFKWKQTKGKDATYTRYISALVKAKCLVEANSVCELLQSGSVVDKQLRSLFISPIHKKIRRAGRSRSLSLSQESSPDLSPPHLRESFRPWDREGNPIALERDTRTIKQQFAHLLPKIMEHFRNYPPHVIVNLLSYYDKSYLDFTKDCIDTEDLISALISNISFLDYDLLEFLTNEFHSENKSELHNYKSAFISYVRERVTVSLHETSLKLDKEMQIHPSDEKKISQLKKIIQENVLCEIDTITIDSSLLPVSGHIVIG